MSDLSLFSCSSPVQSCTDKTILTAVEMLEITFCRALVGHQHLLNQRNIPCLDLSCCWRIFAGTQLPLAKIRVRTELSSLTSKKLGSFFLQALACFGIYISLYISSLLVDAKFSLPYAEILKNIIEYLLTGDTSFS